MAALYGVASTTVKVTVVSYAFVGSSLALAGSAMYALGTSSSLDNGQHAGDETFRTKDLIYIDDKAAVADIDSSDRVSYPTDYAVMNGIMMSSGNQGYEDRQSCWTWLRSAYSRDSVGRVSLCGDLDYDYVDRSNGSLRPALQLNLQSVISARSASDDAFKIDECEVCGRVNDKSFGPLKSGRDAI